MATPLFKTIITVLVLQNVKLYNKSSHVVVFLLGLSCLTPSSRWCVSYVDSLFPELNKEHDLYPSYGATEPDLSSFRPVSTATADWNEDADVISVSPFHSGS